MAPSPRAAQPAAVQNDVDAQQQVSSVRSPSPPLPTLPSLRLEDFSLAKERMERTPSPTARELFKFFCPLCMCYLKGAFPASFRDQPAFTNAGMRASGRHGVRVCATATDTPHSRYSLLCVAALWETSCCKNYACYQCIAEFVTSAFCGTVMPVCVVNARAGRRSPGLSPSPLSSLPLLAYPVALREEHHERHGCGRERRARGSQGAVPALRHRGDALRRRLRGRGAPELLRLAVRAPRKQRQ